MKDFQDMNCKGCTFADSDTVGTGKPCCTYPGKIELIMGRCQQRLGMGFAVLMGWPLPNRADRPATENQEKEAA